MASEDPGSRELGVTTVDSDELQNLMRGEPEVKIADEKKDDTSKVAEEVINAGSERPEPEIRTGEPEQELPEDSKKFLERINSLENELRSLKQVRYQDDVRRLDVEPKVELVEFAPGIRLPKDPSTWPIQLTPDIVRAVGIDPGEKGELARGLNVLANAFFTNVSQALTESTRAMINADQSERSRKEQHVSAFHTAYPDLVGKEDIVDASERIFRANGGHQQGLSQAEYVANVVTRARARLASLRGMTLDQYMGEVNNSRANPNERVPQNRPIGQSRARFGRSGGRVNRPVMNADDRELEEML